MIPDLVPRSVHDTVDALLAGAERREPFVPPQSRSLVRFERVEIGGQRCVVKHLHADADFLLRAGGDPGTRTLRAYGAGLFHAAADVVDCAVIGVALGAGPDGSGAAILMRDVSAELMPPGDDPFPEAAHARFVDSLAGLCARTWDFADDLGLLPYAARWGFFDHATIAREEALGWPEPVPRLARDGWRRFAARAPEDVARAVDALRRDVRPLADALRTTPSCFLHGDWKASNLGVGADGRTVLIDWVYLGEGPACHDIAWYVALNRRRLPRGRRKEAVFEEFRAALERHGVATAGWFERQLQLCLLGALVQFGWEKALGDEEELAWWCDHARAGLRRL